jgi:hypothetical protein
MWRMRGSKDRILIFDPSIVFGSVFCTAEDAEYDDKNVAAIAPKSVKTSNCIRLHVPTSFSVGTFTTGLLPSFVMFARLNIVPKKEKGARGGLYFMTAWRKESEQIK